MWRKISLPQSLTLCMVCLLCDTWSSDVLQSDLRIYLCVSSETFLFGGMGSDEPEIRGIIMREPQGMVTGDSQCRGKLLLLTKPDAAGSSLGCSCTSCGCELFLSEWDWAMLVLWVFRASAVMFRGSRTSCRCSVPWHKGRKQKGILGGDTSVSQGI